MFHKGYTHILHSIFSTALALMWVTPDQRTGKRLVTWVPP